MRRIALRIRRIAAFGREGLSLLDKLKMLVLGYARNHSFDGNDLPARIGRRLWPIIQVRPRALHGLIARINPADLHQLISFDEIFVERVYPLERQPFDPEIVIDCGANIGLFSLLAVAAYPGVKVIAFEPDRENMRILLEHLRLNRLDTVEAIAAAVSDHDGEASFVTGLGIGSALAHLTDQRGTVASVSAVRLASVLERFRRKRLLLKLDVEGAEEEIVPDIAPALPANCSLFFETHRGEEGWDRIARILIDHGFLVERLRCHLPYAEGFAGRNGGLARQ